MQIKERGSRTVFLRFVYNEAKKRTENRSIGTQDLYSDQLDPSVAAAMTDAEKVEAQEWLDNRKRLKSVEYAKSTITALPRMMTQAIKSLDEPLAMEQLSNADFDAIYNAWATLADAMRNAGHKRPRAK